MATILLVDDDEDVRYALAKVLRRGGHVVDVAEDGRQALARLAVGGVNLVISDIIMPEFDGIELLRQVNALFPELPVIAISGGGRIGKAEYLTLATCLGARRTLQKPIEPDELLREVGAVVGAG